MMDFDGNFEFREAATLESATAALQKMESLDYTMFITDYLMRNPPLNQLDAVEAVAFTAQAMPVL